MAQLFLLLQQQRCEVDLLRGNRGYVMPFSACARRGAEGPVDLRLAPTEEPARALRPRTRLSAAALKHHKKGYPFGIPFLVIFER